MGDDFLRDALSAYRITRLVTRDTLTKPLREAALAWLYRNDPPPRIEIDVSTLADRGAGRTSTVPGDEIEFDSYVDRVEWERDDAPKLATLLLCPWCVGVWVGFGVMVLRRAMPRLWSPIADGLALGALAALIEKGEPE